MRPSRWSMLLALVSVGCASPPAEWPPAREGQGISIVVVNDLVDRDDVVVRIVPAGGAPSLLGGVGPGGRNTLEYRAPTLAGRFTLDARAGDGRIVTSRPFTLFADAVVTWRLERNELTVGGGVPS